VAVPGIAVWHELPDNGAGGWETYYDFRNRLILASIYPDLFKLETPASVLRTMMKALSTRDYLSASLIQAAIKDFMKGPALFDEETSAQIHGRVASLSKKFQLRPVAIGRKFRTPKHVKTKGLGSGRLSYTPDLRKLLFLTRACFSAYFRYRRGSHEVARRWRSKIRKFMDERWWKRMFNDKDGALS
jgi:hypothetical protein